jgi:DnaJ-class molecular chaperone
MDYRQNLYKQNSSASSMGMAKELGSSEALQDLIDILKQNYVSDCPHCSGTGTTLKNRACKPCQGLGKKI